MQRYVIMLIVLYAYSLGNIDGRRSGYSKPASEKGPALASG